MEEEDLVTNQDMSNVKKLQKTYSILSALQLPDSVVKQFDLANIDPALVVLKPLKKRFKFHFMDKRKTNNPNKVAKNLLRPRKWQDSIEFHISFLSTNGT